ncbi:hypothetical protein FTX61_07610 [Nitriliruptoraceae bacterium ZYF776]|nr:hypothetical protein [Profundirhabdus halotolerans]
MGGAGGAVEGGHGGSWNGNVEVVSDERRGGGAVRAGRTGQAPTLPPPSLGRSRDAAGASWSP